MKEKRLQINDLTSFLSETPFVLYKIYNQGNWSSIIQELTNIMGNARDAARKNDILEEEYEDQHIPPMNFLKNFPKLPGQDTSKLNNWPWKIQANLKVLHLEVDKGGPNSLKNLLKLRRKINTLRKYGANKYTLVRWWERTHWKWRLNVSSMSLRNTQTLTQV